MNEWIGYCEHKSKSLLGIPNANIGKGYTIFSEMTGLPQKLPWCAIFVHAVIGGFHTEVALRIFAIILV